MRKHQASERHFNPRSPHGERHCPTCDSEFPPKFQSTLPARGATRNRCATQPAFRISIHAPRTGSDGFWHGFYCSLQHFNPRSPHGERLVPSPCCQGADHFNPRSPHGERRVRLQVQIRHACPFQSTLPARGATAAVLSECHSPRNFNPRSPHGERRLVSPARP